LVLMADWVKKDRGEQERGPLDALAGDLATDVHPLQGAVRAAIVGGTLRDVLTDSPGRSATSNELVCMALCLTARPCAERERVKLLADEALNRNPANLAAMTVFLTPRSFQPVRMFRKSGPEPDILWLSPPDPRPPVLDESAVRTIAAAERGLTL